LFMFLGKLAVAVLPGTVAFRYAIFTAILGSTTVLCVYWLLRRAFESRVIALVSSSVYAVSYHQWLYSMVMEVSVLSALFGVLLPLLFWCAYVNGAAVETRSRLFWAMICLVTLAASFTHHYMIVFFLPGLLWFTFADLGIRPGSFRTREWVTLAVCFTFGLAPILYLPYCALREPFIDSGDVSSLGNLFRHLLRSEYGAFSLTASGAGISQSSAVYSDSLAFYFEMLERSFTLVGTIGAVGGIAALWCCHRPLFRLVVPSVVLAGPGFFLLTHMPTTTLATRLTLEKFLPISFVLVPVLIAAALDFATRVLRPAPWLSIALPAAIFWFNLPVLDFRSFDASRKFGEDLFRSVEPGSLLIIHGDAPLYMSWFLQQAEGQRPDLKLLSYSIAAHDEADLEEKFPDLAIPKGLHGAELIKGIIEQNIDRVPVYTHGIPGEKLSEAGLQRNPFVLQPNGLAYKVSRVFDGQADDSRVWDSFALRTKLTGPWVQNNCVAEINEMYMLALHNRSAFFYLNRQLDRGIQYARQALTFDPGFGPTQRALAAMKAEKARRSGL
jgi:hypothetical protein